MKKERGRASGSDSYLLMKYQQNITKQFETVIGIDLGDIRHAVCVADKDGSIIEEMSMVAEGVKTCGVVRELAQEYDLEMPITNEVYKVIHYGNTAKDAFKGLLRQKSGSEADPG